METAQAVKKEKEKKIQEKNLKELQAQIQLFGDPAEIVAEWIVMLQMTSTRNRSKVSSCWGSEKNYLLPAGMPPHTSEKAEQRNQLYPLLTEEVAR